MHERLLEILACPACQSPLRLGTGAQSDGPNTIRVGQLKCDTCDVSYPIAGGIPRLLPKRQGSNAGNETKQKRTAAHFTQEFTALAQDDKDMTSPELLEYYFYSRTGIDAQLYERMPGNPYRTTVASGPGAYRPNDSFLRDKRVLDAGCGPARLTTVPARSAAHVVGLDMGDHIDRAYARCQHLTNTDFVQGSVLEPPFRPGTFDYVFSIGVLHHTPDPRRGCLQLAKLLVADGAMSIWVYPPEYWGGRLRGIVGKLVNKRLSRLPPERSFDISARWLYPIGQVQMALARRRWTKLLTAPLFILSVPRHPQKEVMIATIHDYFGPPIISTHTYNEVQGWLHEAGFEDLRRLPVPISWFAAGRKQ
jgi:uncharacterized protein YbaR (Trm112 family)/2-polyprenyl-3-methyl-5-hydroxy-6-metoxy-1,4-benzoquinol methylase